MTGRDIDTAALAALADLAVRDLRAFAGRKRQIREELLAHLLMIHDEESARAESEGAALAATIERWGDARDIGCQLQRSVPVLERLAMSPLPHWLSPLEGLLWRKTANESTLRHAWRSATWLTSAVAAVGALALGVNACLSARSTHPDRGALYSAEVFGAALFALFASAFVVAASFDRAGLRARLEPGVASPRLITGAIVASHVVAMVVLFLAGFGVALITMPGTHHNVLEVAQLGAVPVWTLAASLVGLFVVTMMVVAGAVRGARTTE